MIDIAITKAIAFLSDGARRHEHKSPNAPHAAETTGKHWAAQDLHLWTLFSYFSAILFMLLMSWPRKLLSYFFLWLNSWFLQPCATCPSLMWVRKLSKKRKKKSFGQAWKMFNMLKDCVLMNFFFFLIGWTNCLVGILFVSLWDTILIT